MKAKPVGFHVLIELEEVESKSKGGIILNQDSVNKEQAATQIGRIVEIGPLAYVGWKGCEHETKKPHECWGVNTGDLVEFKKYEGMVSVVEGFDKHRYIPDSHIVGKIGEES